MTYQRTIALAACAILLSFVVPTPASAVEETYVFVGEDSRGNLIYKIVTRSELDGYASCGGEAPGTFTCNNGPHINFVGAAHGFAFPNNPKFTGYAGSTLTDNLNNVRSLSCNVIAGTPTCGPGVGNWPAAGWSQRCIAHGKDRWECWSDHDAP